MRIWNFISWEKSANFEAVNEVCTGTANPIQFLLTSLIPPMEGYFIFPVPRPKMHTKARITPVCDTILAFAFPYKSKGSFPAAQNKSA